MNESDSDKKKKNDSLNVSESVSSFPNENMTLLIYYIL